MADSDLTDIRYRLKELIIRELFLEGLTPDQIEDDQLLFGEGLGLDSMDALQLVLGMEKEFNLKIKKNDISQESFASVATLADYIHGRLGVEQAKQA